MVVRRTCSRSAWVLPATKHDAQLQWERGRLVRSRFFFHYSSVKTTPIGYPHREYIMQAEELRALQAPLKDTYRNDPAKALVTLRASGSLDASGVSCRVETGRALVDAGLHPATGGTGMQACSGDMLLEALAACAGVTLRAVATALDIPVQGGTVQVEGDLDFRGTLGVSKEAAVGFQAIRVRLDLDTDASQEQLDTLMKLTERYCVVLQTIRAATVVQTTRSP
jgi:uncharacterized OsmC-like protein